MDTANAQHASRETPRIDLIFISSPQNASRRINGILNPYMPMALEESRPDLFVRNIPEQAAVFIIDIIEDTSNHRCSLDRVFI